MLESNLSLTSLVSTAAALMWDDAPGANRANDALLAYSGVGENGERASARERRRD